MAGLWLRSMAIEPGGDTSPTCEPLGPAEVHFLWWFIQGSVMEPETRAQLRAGWGLCARHGPGFMAVEAAYRRGWVHACAVLYVDLMERAHATLTADRPWGGVAAAWSLGGRRRCLMCELDVGPASGVAAVGAALATEFDLASFTERLTETREHWWREVCATCVPDAPGPPCRPHTSFGPGTPRELRAARATVERILPHLRRYGRSFRWDARDTDTAADRAALVSAIGWCSGWSCLVAWFRAAGGSTDEVPSA